MVLRDAFESVRSAISARQVFGEPVDRDGVTVIPAATVIGGGGGGGAQPSRQDDAATGDPGSGAGMGFGLIAWASGAFEIREGQVRWRPAIDATRVILAAMGVVLVLSRAALAARNRS
jgi:uncharacterized spore protein YtfJ